MLYAALVAATLAAVFLALAVLEPLRMAGRVVPGARPAGLVWLGARRVALEAWLAQAALPVAPAVFLWLAGGALALVLVLTSLLISWQVGIALTALLAWGIRQLVNRRIGTRGRFVAEELPAFLRLVIGRLRTGFSLLQALDMAATEGPPLLGAEVRQAISEVNMGASLETALERLAGRMKQPDIDLVVTSLIIGREVGGNLSETLAALAETVAQRARLRRQVRVLTSQPRLSGVIVGVLPFVLLAVMTIIDSDFTLILFRTKAGWLVVAAGLVSQLLGILVIRRILRTGEELLP